jgi:hypothetical protein
MKMLERLGVGVCSGKEVVRKEAKWVWSQV